MKNKIGWCNLTFNPVWGCLNNCEYCYARKTAKRFWKLISKKELRFWLDNDLPDYDYAVEGTPNFLSKFFPIFLNSHYVKKFPKKPQRIFVGSMSEIFYWEECWMKLILKKIRQYPQHVFQFLTKNPFTYLKYEFPQNCWLGLTIVRTPKYPESDRWGFIEFKRNNLNNLKFVCLEPLLENIDLGCYLDLTAIDWVIVGAETGNRKDKIIPDKEWLLYIIKYCDLHKIPVFIKDNLLKYYPKFNHIKEFPNYK